MTKLDRNKVYRVRRNHVSTKHQKRHSVYEIRWSTSRDSWLVITATAEVRYDEHVFTNEKYYTIIDDWEGEIHSIKPHKTPLHEWHIDELVAQPKEEKTMEIKNAILVNGTDVDNISDDTLIGLIEKVSTARLTLNTQLGSMNSKFCRVKIAEMDGQLKALTAILDARVEG